MVDRRRIKRFSDQIARRFRPEKIILFGSYAYGRPTKDSDVDLLVVMPFKGSSHEKAVEIRSAIEAGFPLDLLVRTPQDLRQRIQWEDYFLREIMEKGRVLYKTDYTRMGRKSGRRLPLLRTRESGAPKA